ncbi:MAG: DUF3299 domain-containing protein [Rhodobacteraceae bacterium]|nr:DUF3299 domain-containing protein [Paracoccaceae bacterium]
MQPGGLKVVVARSFCALFLCLATLSLAHASDDASALVGWDALVPETSTQSTQTLLGQDDTWQTQVLDVETELLGQSILIDGYVLPLTWDGRKVTEFLLVPWVGACIHTPAPPPNQIVHVDYPDGLRLDKPYEPVRLSGTLQHAPDAHMLFLVDGSRPIPTAYGLSGAVVAGQPGEISAASASDIPLFARAQLWANGLFTQSMTSLSGGNVTGALFFALLLSFGYGALHTLGPGHGKSVVISYFVGSGGSLGRGITMGTRIAVFHVLSAVVVVFILDFAVRQATGAAPSDYRMIRLASYALITAIGSVMLWQAFKAVQASRAHTVALASHEQDHGHYFDLRPSAHDHHDHGHAHSGCAACVAAAATPTGGGWVAASVGIIPCTGALIVMLFGLANDLIWPAILMVIAISAGMAVAMSAIGVAALWGRQWAERRFDRDSRQRQRFEKSARILGAASVFAIGVILFSLTLAVHPNPIAPTQEIVLRGDANPPLEG